MQRNLSILQETGSQNQYSTVTKFQRAVSSLSFCFFVSKRKKQHKTKKDKKARIRKFIDAGMFLLFSFCGRGGAGVGEAKEAVPSAYKHLLSNILIFRNHIFVISQDTCQYFFAGQLRSKVKLYHKPQKKANRENL